MHCLPFHRWQGGLFGSHVGQWLPELRVEPAVISYLQISQHLTQILGEKGQVFEQDWLNLAQQYSGDLKRSCSGHLIIALLPLFLFAHDSKSELEQYLNSLQALWQLPSETLEELFIWGRLTSLILTDQFQPQQGLAHLIKVAPNSLKQLLECVETSLKNAIPLHQVSKRLLAQGKPNQLEILLSLYCFLSTPDDFHLSVLRAFQLQHSALVLSLTGFLSGIYNTPTGFPLFWRMAVQDYSLAPLIEQQTRQMFAMWSGVYEPNLDVSLFTTPLAASGVIQRRRSLNLISHDPF